MAAEISPRAKIWLAVASIPIILYTLAADRLAVVAVVQDRSVGQRPQLHTRVTGAWTAIKYILTGGAHTLFVPALLNSIGICLIATIIGVALSSLCAYGIARLDFPGQAADPQRGAADRVLPGDQHRHPAVQPLARDRPLQHLAGPDHPVPVADAADLDLDVDGVLPADPVGDGAGGSGRRRDELAGVPQGRPAAGDARGLHDRDHLVLHRVERLRLLDRRSPRPPARSDSSTGRRPSRPRWASSPARRSSSRRPGSWRRPRSSSPFRSSCSCCCSRSASSPA